MLRSRENLRGFRRFRKILMQAICYEKIGGTAHVIPDFAIRDTA